MIATISAAWTGFWSNRRGNVLMIFAFAMIPMVFATGMGIDYTRAARLKTKLNAIADAAALAAVTQPMMNETDLDKVRDRAETMFQAQADGLEGLSGTPVVHVDVCQPPMKSCTKPDPDHPNGRIATVSYTANSINLFGGVLKMRTIAVGGSSTATAVAAPNMDFYIALDTSPSMALPTTTSGFQRMDSAVGCAFACHSNKIEAYAGGSLPHGLILDNTTYSIVKATGYPSTGSGSNEKQQIDSKGTYVYVNRPISKYDSYDTQKWCNKGGRNVCIYNADGSFVDSYWYALNQSVRLRVTDERSAVVDLMTLAQSYAEQNKRVYHASLYTFDHASDFKTLVDMPAPHDPSNLSDVAAKAKQVELVTVNDKAGNGRPPNGESGTTYLFTSYKQLFDEMLGKKPGSGILPEKSGQGSDAPDDTPQGYLFIVTDGMSDEKSSLVHAPYSLGENRTRSEMVQDHIDQCNTIKAHGFKIAILYTEYTSASIKDDEPNQRDFVDANIKDVAPALTACASPGLMYTVKTDQSISGALQTLFAKAIANARLKQ